MGRSGRPRKPGQRHPSGGLKQSRPKDKGNERVANARKMLEQSKSPDLLSFPLGIMYANNNICVGKYEAGCQYARLYAMMYGRPSYAAVAYAGVTGGRDELLMRLSDAKALETQSELVAAQERLMIIGRVTKDMIENLVVFERVPRWMSQNMPGPKDVREAQRTLLGLTALADVFKIRQEAA